jgi:hypothetical protein
MYIHFEARDNASYANLGTHQTSHPFKVCMSLLKP